MLAPQAATRRRLLCVHSPLLLVPFAWRTSSERAHLSLLSVLLTPADKRGPRNTVHKNTDLDLPGPVFLHWGRCLQYLCFTRGETEAERGPRRPWPCLQTSCLQSAEVGQEEASGIEVRDSAKHPTIHGAAPQRELSGLISYCQG